MASLEERRPSPDELLAVIKQEEMAARRGRLKIFFGAAPGVGKTYAMLRAARQDAAKGTDVVIGYLETHGRKETQELAEGLPTIPRHTIPYKGVTLEEFDLAAALARKPGLLLVDELAHSNAPGSVHKKRWQDVEDLLDAGINVYTTLNVQHLESVNEVILRITGVQVRETLPDHVLEKADEIALVDISDEDLLQRLKDGKVYLGEGGQRALLNFFRKGNLIALRQLALRLAADRVDLELRSFRALQPSGEAPAGGRDRILVAVGSRPEDEHLIRATYHLATALRAEWLAVHVDTSHGLLRNPKARAWVWNHLHLAESLGAETAVLTGIRVAKELLAYASLRDVTQIVVGQPAGIRQLLRWWSSSIPAQLLGNTRHVDIIVHPLRVDERPETRRRRLNRLYLGMAPTPKDKRQRVTGYMVSAALGIGLSGLAWVIGTARFGVADAFMLYLMGAVGTAFFYGRWPSLVTLLAAVVSYYAFGLSRSLPNTLSSLLSFGIILSLALLISQLVARSRDQEEMARLRERRVRNLYTLAQALASVRGVNEVMDVARQQLDETLGVSVFFWLPEREGADAADTLRLHPPDMELPASPEALYAAARWSFVHMKMAGVGTDTLPDIPALFLPLPGPDRPVGIMMVADLEFRRAPSDWLRFLETVARLLGVTLESARRFTKSRDAEVQLQVEQLHNALLGTVSHDLRTPLASVVGAATTLTLGADTLSEDERNTLLGNVLSESERMSQMVNRILDMARLQSASVELKKDWYHLDDLVGAALKRVQPLLAEHPTAVRIPPDYPLLHVDGHLIEEVLVNLLENAAKYTPEGTLIEVEAATEAAALKICVIDHGHGVRRGTEEEIFRRFSHVKPLVGKSGTGLGLAICDAIVRLHGGSIWVSNRVMVHGAVFCFTLPREAPPAPPSEDA